MNFIFKVIISAIAVFISAYILPGVSVDGFITAIIVAFVIAVLNVLLRPLLVFFTIPVTFFTLGLFLLVINAFIIIIASKFVAGFNIDGFWHALLFGIILSVITYILELPNRKKLDNQNESN
jgi:putative membrane protein